MSMNLGENQATAAPNMSGIDEITKILNKKVDLITNSNIRYEGVLIQIKTQDKRLLLKDVKSFGTEGRNGGINEVPTPAADDPNNLYSFVEFQIPMIKGLYVVEQPLPVPSDPAIVSVQKEEKPAKEPIKDEDESMASSSKGHEAFYDENDLDEGPSQRGSRGYRRGRARRGGYGDSGRSRRGRGYNRGGYERGSGYQQSHKGFRDSDCNYHLQEKFKDEFDFSKHELQKEEVKDEKSESKEIEEQKKTKEENEAGEGEKVSLTAGDGFFDDFSNSNLASENEEGRGGRSRGPRSRGGRRGYRGNRGYRRGGYDGEGYYDSQHYKKPRFDNNENYNDTKYNSSKEDELSFPDYVAPQVHYRGAKRGATNQGFKGRTDRGRFSGFSSLQED